MADEPPRAPKAAKFPLRLDQMAGGARSSRSGAAKAPVAPQTLRPVAVASREVLRPQRPLQHAASESARRSVPTGLGLDSEGVRRQMSDRLRREGLRHEAVLDALATTPRHRFVDAALVTQAYEDTSLPIGHGQTISKPSVVGRMIELLMAGASARAGGGLGRVMEIGTGCGYQAALLSLLARQVLSIERIKPLHDKARELLAPLHLRNVRLVYGDGMLGHPPDAPYDAIIAAAGGDALPQAWLDQLAVGGRLVAPLSDANGRQSLLVVDRSERGFERGLHETVQFVPLKSGVVR